MDQTMASKKEKRNKGWEIYYPYPKKGYNNKHVLSRFPYRSQFILSSAVSIIFDDPMHFIRQH